MGKTVLLVRGAPVVGRLQRYEVSGDRPKTSWKFPILQRPRAATIVRPQPAAFLPDLTVDDYDDSDNFNYVAPVDTQLKLPRRRERLTHLSQGMSAA